ncbi:MAG: WecB/TagA/CpsF family glycosyltransferase [Acidimicrobiales bacterium]
MTRQTSSDQGRPDSAIADTTPRDPRATDGLERRTLFGLDFVDAPSLDPVLEAVLNQLPAGGDPLAADSVLPVLVTPNVDILVQLRNAEHSIEAGVMRRAQYVLPDGMPIVAASRLLGSPLASRLTGSGLFEMLWPALVAQDRPVLVLTASTAIARRLSHEAPTAAFVTPPLFDAGDADAVDRVVDELIREAEARRPELVLFGIGHPKDPIVAARFLERWPLALGRRPLCCCLGGSFAMYAGFKRRAPGWMQKAGLEWFFRFVQEPRRLFHRYFVRDVAFLAIVGRALRTRRQGGGDDAPGGRWVEGDTEGGPR